MSTPMGEKEERILRAISRVHDGDTLTSAARSYGIPRKTLASRLEGRKSHSEAAIPLQRLTPEQEQIIVDWILLEEECGRAPTRRNIAAFGSEILAIQEDTRPLGLRWVDSFIRRHEAIHTKIGRVVEASRVKQTKKERIDEFYTLLERLRAKYAITPSNEFNMDETGVQEGETHSGTVVGTSQTRRTRIAESEATAWVSFIHYISLSGDHGTPEYTATKKGWSNKVIANRWLEEIFLPETKPQNNEWRLLILDGHSTHVHPEFMFKAFANRVILLYLPAHASDDLQPLDVGVFSALKSAYRSELRGYASYSATAPIYKQRMLAAYERAYEKAFTSHNIRAGWRRSGLYPLNREFALISAPGELEASPLPQTPDTPPHRSAEPPVTTPKKAADIAEAVRKIAKNHGPLPREARALLNKAGKSIATLSAQLACERRNTAHLDRELQKYEPDKRQRVEKNPNHVFAGLTEIRSAQDKLEKRLRPLTETVQTEIDTFVEHDPPRPNKARRTQ